MGDRQSAETASDLPSPARSPPSLRRSTMPALHMRPELQGTLFALDNCAPRTDVERIERELLFPTLLVRPRQPPHLAPKSCHTSRTPTESIDRCSDRIVCNKICLCRWSCWGAEMEGVHVGVWCTTARFPLYATLHELCLNVGPTWKNLHIYIYVCISVVFVVFGFPWLRD